MDIVKGRGKTNFIVKTWKRCRSIHRGSMKSQATIPANPLSKSKSWSGRDQKPATKVDKSKRKSQIAPEGCFAVYVGEERQRFVIKTEYTNHPLFRMLLEDAAMEYGYNSEGLILLPCEVNFFYKVLAEMDMKEIRRGWGFVYGSCSPFNPIHCLGNSDMAKGYGSYGLLTPSPLLKMNQF